MIRNINFELSKTNYRREIIGNRKFVVNKTQTSNKHLVSTPCIECETRYYLFCTYLYLSTVSRQEK